MYYADNRIRSAGPEGIMWPAYSRGLKVLFGWDLVEFATEVYKFVAQRTKEAAIYFGSEQQR